MRRGHIGCRNGDAALAETKQKLVKAACACFEAEWDASVDALLGSPSAKSLVKIDIYDTNLTAAGMLRLAKHTSVRKMVWNYRTYGRREDEDLPFAELKAIADAVKARGGEAQLLVDGDRLFDFDQ